MARAGSCTSRASRIHERARAHIAECAGARGSAIARALLKAPIHVYRWTLKPYVGWSCRHVPTCSEYALEAIDKHGAWRGFWLTAGRLARCHPWGTKGHDPVP